MQEISPTGAAKPERLLQRTEAAAYIRETYGVPCSPKTLAKLACVSSDGPPFRKASRTPLYSRTDLDAWAQARIGPRVRSTSELKRPQPRPSHVSAYSNINGNFRRPARKCRRGV
jgi:hypothetical protein